MHRLEREGRVSKVMKNIVDVLRLEAGTLPLDLGTFRPVDLAAKAIVMSSTRAHTKSLVLDGLVADVGLVRCDGDRITGVLCDLIENAIEASPPRGEVRVRAEKREDDVIITVTDTGPGIEPADWARLFEAAWQIPEERRSGAGLSLAHAKAVVEAHGGAIGATSRRGEGTTFWLTLPPAD